MSNLYKKTMQQIKVPDALIEKTASEMRRVQEAPAPRPRFAVYTGAGALAACLFITFISLFMMRHPASGDFILTPLSQDAIVREVEVSEGRLVFDEALLTLAPELKFGLWAAEMQTWEIERYMMFLGMDPRPSALPEGFVATAEKATVYVLGEGEVYSDELLLRYERETDGAWITMYVSAGRLPAGALSEAEPNSEICGIPIFTGYIDPYNQFHTQFVIGDIGYSIASSKITQEEFIRFLCQFFYD